MCLLIGVLRVIFNVCISAKYYGTLRDIFYGMRDPGADTYPYGTSAPRLDLDIPTLSGGDIFNGEEHTTLQEGIVLRLYTMVVVAANMPGLYRRHVYLPEARSA